MRKELLNRIKNIKKAIENIEIQGATNVAKSSVQLILLYLRTFKKGSDLEKVQKDLFAFMDEVAHLRKTEPLSRNAMKFIKYYLKKSEYNNLTELKHLIKVLADDFLSRLDEHKEKIAKHGAKLIKNNENIFTHCHSSMVENIFIYAHKEGKKFHVYNDETRPLYQGHITSEHLRKAGIKNTIVVDGASSFLISKYSGKNLMMDKVFLGTDAISLDGSCVNKIGSYGISLSAHNEKIPLYIASSLLKIDIEALAGEEIEIEERPAWEVWDNPPKGLTVINLAFDLIPKKHITAFITEFGLVKSKDIKKVVKENYPFLFE